MIYTYKAGNFELLALKANKSPGHGKWHPHFFREIADAIYLSMIFWKSLKEAAHIQQEEGDYSNYLEKGKKSYPDLLSYSFENGLETELILPAKT